MECKFTDEYEVLTENGFQSFSGIKKTNELSYKITFNDSSDIICSYNHKFYENGVFIRAYDLKVGDILAGKIITAIDTIGYTDLYDLLEVENGHHYTANDIEVSNCAFIPKNVWENFYSSTFPTISSGKDTKMILVSTPNSKNHFFDFWIAAKNGKSNMVPIEVNWWDVPGRDEKWHQDQLKQMSEAQFDQEFGNSFEVEQNTLLPQSTIRRISINCQDPIESSANMKIYEKPIPHHQYIASVDVALGNGGDYSVITVIDVSVSPIKVVLVFSTNKMDYYGLPSMVFSIATKYNNAKALVESNDLGGTVLHILNYELEYDNLVKTYVGAAGRPILGQRTTKKTKLMGCNTLKDLIDNEKIIIPDKGTVEELSHFQLIEDSYAAAPGYHDDKVMVLVNFAYYMTTRQFQNEFDRNMYSEYKDRVDNEIMESLAPIPLFSGNNYGDEEAQENIEWLN